MLDLVITNVPDRVRVREVLSPKESDVFTDMARCLLNSRLYKSYSLKQRHVNVHELF